MADPPADQWKLYYHSFLPGRGDFVRLMFEELGIQYEDVCRTKGSDEMTKLVRGEHGGWPVRAPPIIQNGDFYLSQTPAILQYLGRKYGACPTGGLEEEGRAEQVNLMVCDLMAEGHDCYHPLDKCGSYESQKDAAAPLIGHFRKTRLPKYVEFLEKALQLNDSGRGFFFGNKLTYVDVAVFQALRAVESQFPNEYKSLEIPLLHAFKERIAARPRIAAFLASPRSLPFCGNSMM